LAFCRNSDEILRIKTNIIPEAIFTHSYFKQMKKPAQNCMVCIVIAAGLCLASYGSKNQNKFTYNIHQDQLLDSYQEYIGSLNPNNLFTIDAAVKKFKEAFVHCPTNITDAAFLQFWNFYLTAADYAGERLTHNERYKYLAGINDYNSNPGSYKSLEYDLILEKHALNKNDFKLLNLLNSCGLMFDIKEGYLIINFGENNFILNNFGNNLSAAMRDYIFETIKEAGEKLIENDKLVLPVNKLAERTAWWKNFINRNKNFILISECKLTYGFYLNTLLHRINNTEIKAAVIVSNHYK
jgi:hypothetical protein